MVKEITQTKKSAGIIMHITSLPSKYGIGTLGIDAYKFVDFLAETGNEFWQILPLGITTYGDSPYQSPSAYAGNPYLIDLEELIKEELLTGHDCDSANLTCSFEMHVDYLKQYNNRMPLLKKAFKTFKKTKDYHDFVEDNQNWLYDYAVFMAIKEANNQESLCTWAKKYPYSNIEEYKKEFRESIEYNFFLQYKFFSQYKKLKNYANSKQVKIIGDMPIYVSADSVEVWKNGKFFILNEDLSPKKVAGVPPDDFSNDGQLWGNPIYNWEGLASDNYEFWIERIGFWLKNFDFLRIDHFRGFAGYYSIDCAETTARKGEWIDAPGFDLFALIKSRLGLNSLIAEDLGFIDSRTKKLLEFTALPGMKMLHFSFGKNDPEVKNFAYNNIVYTSSHDSDTTLGWWKKQKLLSKLRIKKRAKNYGCKQKNPVDTIINIAMKCPAKIAMVPIQDYLYLDNQFRMNTPSTLGGTNWKFRVPANYITKDLENSVSKILKKYSRQK